MNLSQKIVHRSNRFKAIKFKIVFFCTMIGMASIVDGAVATWLSPIKIEAISSLNLEKERQLFVDVINTFQNNISGLSEASFLNEERKYQETLDSSMPSRLFFHALLEDQVVGYISCDIDHYHVVTIEQMFVAPEMFDVSLIKELLFAIVSAVPNFRQLYVYCLPEYRCLASALEELGMSQKGSDVYWRGDIACYQYGMTVNSKCKICDVLYADMWDQEDDTDSNWSDLEGPLDDELGGNSPARMVSPLIEEEQLS